MGAQLSRSRLEGHAIESCGPGSRYGWVPITAVVSPMQAEKVGTIRVGKEGDFKE